MLGHYKKGIRPATWSAVKGLTSCLSGAETGVRDIKVKIKNTGMGEGAGGVSPLQGGALLVPLN